jgi:hypothetical protein
MVSGFTPDGHDLPTATIQAGCRMDR